MIARSLAVAAIRLYRLVLSPILPPACRFMPTCSEYAAEAIEKHGLWRGGRLAMHRVSRCGPWHPGGFDPVPSRKAP
jgi:putative membrane protein insertion efficiency factor